MSLLHVDMSYRIISSQFECFSPYSAVGTMTNQRCSIKCILLGNDHGEFNAMLVYSLCFKAEELYLILGVEEKTAVCRLVSALSLIYW